MLTQSLWRSDVHPCLKPLPGPSRGRRGLGSPDWRVWPWRVRAHWEQCRGVGRLFLGLCHSLWEIGSSRSLPGWAGITLCITRNQSLTGLFWLMLVALGLLRTIQNNEPHLQIFSWGPAPSLTGKKSRSVSTSVVPQDWDLLPFTWGPDKAEWRAGATGEGPAPKCL